MAPERANNLGTNLTKEVPRLCPKKPKPQLEDTEDLVDINTPHVPDQKTQHYDGKTPQINLQGQRDAYQNPQIPAAFLAEIDKLVLKFIWKVKGPRTVKTIVKKNNKKA